MKSSSPIVSSCPGCQAHLNVTRLSCTQCSIQLEGAFAIPLLSRLSAADQAFVLSFVRSSGSLKAMSAQLGQSYPTIRARLNTIIAQLEDEGPDVEALRHEVLDAIASGEVTPEEGAKRLRELM